MESSGGAVDFQEHLSSNKSETSALPALTLLERGFPFRELSLLCQADRRGRDPSYGLHRWWARRPPALVRGILLAAFSSPTEGLAEFWKRYASPKNHLNGQHIHDPFLGGGSTVVEACRLGATATGTDVDPLACLIARHESVHPDAKALGEQGAMLADFLDEQVGAFYRASRKGWTPLHWFWISLVTCPGCDATSPLYRSLILARDTRKVGAVVRDSGLIVFCPSCFKIHSLSSSARKSFVCCGRLRVSQATFSAHKFNCPTCHRRSDHSQLKTLRSSHRLLAVEETHPTTRRRIRGVVNADKERLAAADQFLSDNGRNLPLPRLPFSQPRRDSRPTSFGADLHTDLFYPRQLVTFGTAIKWINDSKTSAPIREALLLAISHALASNNRLCGYATDYGRLSSLFSVRSYSLPALSVELNPLHPTAGRGTLSKILRERLSESRGTVRRSVWDAVAEKPTSQTLEFVAGTAPGIRCASALAPYEGPMIDFAFFDPPYFDYISYSELSEFYRAWLGQLEIGGRPLLPDDARPIDSFSDGLAGAIGSLRAGLRAPAPFAFTFHSTSSDAWAAIARALRIAEQRITAMWPVLTDPHMGHHGADGACEWDVVVVCRPDFACTPRDAPSPRDWFHRLRGLTVRPTDRAALELAVRSLRGLFGKVRDLQA